MEFKSFTCPCCDRALVRARSKGQDVICSARELEFRDVVSPNQGAYVVAADNSYVFESQGRLSYLKRVDDLVAQVSLPLVDIVDLLNREFTNTEFLLVDISYRGWWAKVILFGAIGEVQVLEARLQASGKGHLWEVCDDRSFNITQQVAQDMYLAIEQHIKETQ